MFSVFIENAELLFFEDNISEDASMANKLVYIDLSMLGIRSMFPGLENATRELATVLSTNNKMVSLNNLRMPIEGKVVSHFNQATEFGFLTKGIIIRTNFGEKVRAPSEGRVVFSGPFHEYGMLLIIDHGAGYHTVLAGLDHIYKTLDQYVLLGEPVGIMNSLNEKQPELYMELRRRGHPINPLPWLATNNNKVSGG